MKEKSALTSLDSFFIASATKNRPELGEQPKENQRCKHRSNFSFVRKPKQVSISPK